MNCVKRYREQAGLSQLKLSRLSGVSQSIISNIESDQTKQPRISTIKSIATVLGFDWTEFYKDGNANKPS